MKKNYCIYALVLLLVVFAQFRLSGAAIYNRQPAQVRILPHQFANAAGYVVEGSSFRMVTEDPQLFIYNAWGWDELSRLTILFEEPAQDEIGVELYYIKNDRFLKKSDSFVFPKGETERGVSLKRECGDFIRVDINGDFTLAAIELKGTQATLSVVKTILYLIVCAALDAGLAFFMVKRWRQPWEQIKRGYFHVVDGLFCIGRKLHITIYRFYIVFAILLGVAYSFLVPVRQIPDEQTHLMRICSTVGAEDIYNQCTELLERIGANEVSEQGVRVDTARYFEQSMIKFDRERIHIRWKAGFYVLSYFPMIAGLLTGYLLDMPILWCLQLAELFALLFAVWLGYLALRLMPVKKELFCAILLLPMNLQQCASLNYDAVLLPFSYLFIAYVFYLKYREEKVKWKDACLIAVMLLFIAAAKALYILLAFLWFIIPIAHTDLSVGRWNASAFFAKHKFLFAALLAVLFAGCCFIVRDNTFIMPLRACFLDPKHTLMILRETTKYKTDEYLLSFVGNFGLLDAKAPKWMINFVLLFLLFFTQEKNPDGKRITVLNRALIGGLALVCAVFINLSMVIWTTYLMGLEPVTLAEYRDAVNEVVIILGVQGRYFLPIAPLIYLFWEGVIKIKREHMLLGQMVYYAVIAVMPILVLLSRYWLV